MTYLPRKLLLEVPTCPLCGAEACACRGDTPDPEHLLSYPFLPGGKDPMAEGVYTITAEDGHVWDPANGLLVGAPGHKIPLARAVELGLTSAPSPEEPSPQAVTKVSRTKTRPKPQETR